MPVNSTNSYSNSTAVITLIQHLGNTVAPYFNTTTIPTLTGIVTAVDDNSHMLNLALAEQGVNVPVSNATSKGACAWWVKFRAAGDAEVAALGGGFGLGDEQRAQAFYNMAGSAAGFAHAFARGLLALGETADTDSSEFGGPVFTAQDIRANRSDPANSALRQPFFRRGQYSWNSTGQ